LLFLYGTLHRERRAHLAGLGSSLYASSTQHERLQIPFGLGKARHQARDRIYTTSSWLKGQDRFATPAVLGILHPLPVYLLLSSSSMIQGTGAVWMWCGGASPYDLPDCKAVDALASLARRVGASGCPALASTSFQQYKRWGVETCNVLSFVLFFIACYFYGFVVVKLHKEQYYQQQRHSKMRCGRTSEV
jgi:hypothetical protein